jgi:hypothetical protein
MNNLLCGIINRYANYCLRRCFILEENEIKQFLITNWAKMSLEELQSHLKIDLYNLLTLAYNLKLGKKKTPDVGRRWTQEEDKFLCDNAYRLTIPEACNLLYRSRYATYQRVKLLQLEQMINKRLR